MHIDTLYEFLNQAQNHDSPVKLDGLEFGGTIATSMLSHVQMCLVESV